MAGKGIIGKDGKIDWFSHYFIEKICIDNSIGKFIDANINGETVTCQIIAYNKKGLWAKVKTENGKIMTLGYMYLLTDKSKTTGAYTVRDSKEIR